MCGILSIIQYGQDCATALDMDSMKKSLTKLGARGPDRLSYYWSRIENTGIFFGFTRLAIMNLSESGQQPFQDNTGMIIANGEIYNYLDIAEKYDIKHHQNCDCRVLLPLLDKVGFVEVVTNILDAEFSMVYYEKSTNTLYAARDRYGVRPLYWGYNTSTKTIAFGSELKSLHDIMEHVEQVVPNMICRISLSNQEFSTSNISFEPYYDYNMLVPNYRLTNTDDIHNTIRRLLTDAVAKRLVSDRPIGFLLSGGLDSSLIVAIASRILGPDKITCFSIGIDGSPDVEAAKCVIEWLNIPKTQHHIIPFDVNTGIECISKVIECIETYDITTVRASTPQYLMAKYIQSNTNIRVILSGEGSDEIHGSYRYFRTAPDALAFHNETIRLLQELYLFDNKRTDRTMSGNGLEVRVPFLDYAYVEFIKLINPQLLMYRSNYMEKQIVRDAFVGYLPHDILYRSKEAFSDAVSNGETNWANCLLTFAQTNKIDGTYDHNQPQTVDAMYFRQVFEKIYPNRGNVLPHYWLPKFQSTNVTDPSARVLDCY